MLILNLIAATHLKQVVPGATEDWESFDNITTVCERAILERLGRSQATL